MDKIHVVSRVITWLLLLSLGLAFESRGYLLASEVDELRALEVKGWTFPDKALVEVEQEIVRYVQRDPRDAYAFYLLSHIHLRKFMQPNPSLIAVKTATELAQQSIDLDPKSDYGYVALANALDAMGQTAQAREVLNSMASVVAEPSWRYYFMLARLDVDAGSVERTLGLLQQSLRMPSSLPDIVVPYVVALLQASTDESKLLKEIRIWDKQFAHDIFKLSIAEQLTKEQRFQDAHALYEALHLRNERNYEAKLNDAVVLYRYLKNPQKAYRILHEMLETLRDDPAGGDEIEAMAHLHSGAALLALNKETDAELALIEGVTKSTDQLTAIEFSVESFERILRATSIPEFLHKLSFEVPGNAFIFALQGHAYATHLRQYDSAAKSYMNAIVLDPQRSEYYGGLGLALFKQRKFENALQAFEEAVRIDPTDSSSFYNIACSLAQLGRMDDALVVLRRAFNLDSSLGTFALNDADLKQLSKRPEFQQMVSDVRRKNQDEFETKLSH